MSTPRILTLAATLVAFASAADAQSPVTNDEPAAMSGMKTIGAVVWGLRFSCSRASARLCFSRAISALSSSITIIPASACCPRFYRRNSARCGVFMPSFGDKTGDKTLLPTRRERRNS
jgi:hypothetical protein